MLFHTSATRFPSPKKEYAMHNIKQTLLGETTSALLAAFHVGMATSPDYIV